MFKDDGAHARTRTSSICFEMSADALSGYRVSLHRVRSIRQRGRTRPSPGEAPRIAGTALLRPAFLGSSEILQDRIGMDIGEGLGETKPEHRIALRDLVHAIASR